ncbi:MAG: glycosyl transferase [Verrucomicrobiales bacterium]|nr:glycosyl transferase [Verrucomicrobiales bacterium]|tara:strand:+ start:426 stop:1208 length:783 start_codon:yes stop_codon:yes gene_type:complete
MNLDEITPMLLTYNEEPNLGRALEKLKWAKQILVLDSFSTDKTKEIAKSCPQVKWVQRKFDSFAGQCNFGLKQIESEWVLSMDCDYIVRDELVEELKGLRVEVAHGFRASFVYCIWGHPLRATLYPPRTVLYRREKAKYQDEGHGHRVDVDGRIGELRGKIEHDDRKSLDRWFASQNKYMIIESKNLLSTPMNELKLQDRLRRRIIVAPWLVFFYTLIWQRLILDGWPGWYYVFQRVLAETMLALRLAEAKVLGSSSKPS